MKKLWVLLLFAASAHGQSLDHVGTGELLLFNPAWSDWTTGMQLGTRVDMHINGMMAEVTLEQRFHNDTDDWVEGKYVFPLPETAAVNAMTIRIGERLIVGEIHEKQAAKQIYENAKREGKRTALVRQSRPNLFASKVANVGPGEEISVTLTYLQKVEYRNGRFSLRFPMTITPRYVPGQSGADETSRTLAPQTDAAVTPSQAINPITIRADINAGLPLADVSSTYHEVRIERRDNRYDISLANGPVPMDQDFELTWQPVASAAPRVAAFTQTVDDEHYALIMVVPPERAAARRLKREAIFIIDTSGSMSGASMEQARVALGRALDTLAPDDTFNIIAFADSPVRLFPEARLASGAYLYDARRFVDGLRSGGGTEMRPALEAALTRSHGDSDETLRQVVFITDGSVANEEELFRLIDTRLGQSRLFTVGIGSAPNSYFMRKAAQYGRGTFTHIGQLNEVQGKMAELFVQLESPVLRDVRVSWPGDAESYPQPLPDLYAGQPLVVTAKLDKLADYATQGAQVSGLTPVGTWDQVVRFSGSDSRGVGTLWARDKISALNDRIISEGESDTLRDAVIDVALMHRLVSRYTSFVAVDKTPARPANAALRDKQVSNQQPAGQTFALPQTATPAVEKFWLGVLSLAVALQLWWLRRRDLLAKTAQRVEDHD